MSRSRLLSVLVSVRPSAAAIHTGSKPSALAALPRPHDAPLPARRRPAPRCSQGSWNAPPAAGGDVIAAASLAGRRPVNEDRYHVRQLNADVLLVGVFDGHGGAAAANYARQHLADIVTAMLRPGCDLEEVLEEAFLALDDGFARSVSQDPEGVGAADGTTATVCLLRAGRHLAVAHVGDTSAVLCRGGAPLRLTAPHCAADATERRRVEAAGGRLVSGGVGRAERVNGRLDMTRSIGDVDLKPYGVTAMPSTTTIEVRAGEDAFLVLATDGVTGTLDDCEIVEAIGECGGDPERAAKTLTEQALNYGSHDNLTAVVVALGAWGRRPRRVRPPAAVPFSIGRSVFGPRYN